MKVQELIDNLKCFDPDMEVKYTLGGSCNFGKITYVDEEQDGYYDKKENWIDDNCVVIGKLTW